MSRGRLLGVPTLVRTDGFLSITLMTAAFAVGAASLATRAQADFTIGGVNYAPVGSAESVIAPFNTAVGAASANQYSGLVLISVAGIGQSYSSDFNDAFYYSLGDTSFSHQGGFYYQMVATKSGSLQLSTSYAASSLVVYDVDAGKEVKPPYIPVFRPDHTYRFVLNTAGLGGPSSSILRFGVGDVLFGDNTGAYTIQITQLLPATVPEPSSLLMATIACGLFGGIHLRRRLSRLARTLLGVIFTGREGGRSVSYGRIVSAGQVA